MKIRVAYTYEITGDDLVALDRYAKEPVTRDMLRQLLIDLGQEGIAEQINQGRTWLDAGEES